MKSKLTAGFVVVFLYLWLAVLWANLLGDQMKFSTRWDLRPLRRGIAINGGTDSETCSRYPNGIEATGQGLGQCFR